MILHQLDEAFAGSGLTTRGGFRLSPADRLPAAEGADAATLVLIGNVGGAMWQAFAAATDAAARATAAHPLDDWTRVVVAPVAARFGARPLYPFEGPPYHPFQQWARRALALGESPIGPLIDAEAGLWHAFRAALLFPGHLPLPVPVGQASPCATCRERACLTTCPVDAIGRNRTDVAACVDHVQSPAGAACRSGGCRARNACPVGGGFRYPPAQLHFHMARFLSAHGGHGQG
ncbi:MAG: hypothetical protein EA406_08980 [Rhodospirillales bacterium]|nr:MAG: hypothetical protein EA406_08980 [Rhodospirillales bacterium]